MQNSMCTSFEHRDKNNTKVTDRMRKRKKKWRVIRAAATAATAATAAAVNVVDANAVKSKDKNHFEAATRTSTFIHLSRVRIMCTLSYINTLARSRNSHIFSSRTRM